MRSFGAAIAFSISILVGIWVSSAGAGLINCGTAPVCGGLCAGGEACAPLQNGLGTGAEGSAAGSGEDCFCQTIPCAGEFPTCEDECPGDNVCQPVAQYQTTGGGASDGGAGQLQGECLCVPPLPCGETFPTCGGMCPDGLECALLTSNFSTTQGGGAGIGDCSCIPEGESPCGGEPSACGGVCLPGQVCVDSSTLAESTAGGGAAVDGCVCASVSCGDFPTCGGECPPDTSCHAVSEPDGKKKLTGGGAFTGGDCLCLPDNPSCGESLGPQCGGSCPDGFFCDAADPLLTSGGGAGTLQAICECVEEPFDPGIVVGNCGEIRPEPGCTNNACEACICDIDPFCCEVEWDEQCALEAAGMFEKKKKIGGGGAGDGVGGDCSAACLVQNLPRPAPTLSLRGTMAAILALLTIGYLALRRTRAA